MLSLASGCTGATRAEKLAAVVGEQRLEDREVEAALEVHGVGDGAGREQLQRDRDVTEGQVEVDQGDALGALLAQGQGEVDRDRGLADATLGGEDGDLPAAGAAGDGDAAVERLPDLLGPRDRGAQAGEVALVDDLAHAGAQGLGQHAGVDPATDQDDADRRDG